MRRHELGERIDRLIADWRPSNGPHLLADSVALEAYTAGFAAGKAEGAKEEREACAAVADNDYGAPRADIRSPACRIAAVIRARGQSEDTNG